MSDLAGSPKMARASGVAQIWFVFAVQDHRPRPPADAAKCNARSLLRKSLAKRDARSVSRLISNDIAVSVIRNDGAMRVGVFQCPQIINCVLTTAGMKKKA